jgi:hypothetical protein
MIRSVVTDECKREVNTCNEGKKKYNPIFLLMKWSHLSFPVILTINEDFLPVSVN